MALLDEVAADLPATNPLKLLHTGFLDEPKGLPGVNRLVRVVNRDRGEAAVAAQDGYRVSLQVAWNLLTDLKLQVPRTEGEPEVLPGIGLIHRIHEVLRPGQSRQYGDIVRTVLRDIALGIRSRIFRPVQCRAVSPVQRSYCDNIALTVHRQQLAYIVHLLSGRTVCDS
jgi:hypothetical protein